MGWFGRKNAEDVIDNDLKTYFKGETSPNDTAVVDPVVTQQPELVAKEPVPLSLPETKLQSREKNLKQIAMDNCVEYEKAYSDCLLRGTLWERFTSCPTQKTMHDKCVDLQAMALEVLGYNRVQTDEDKVAIKGYADDLMIKHVPRLTIMESEVEAFKAALPSPPSEP